MAIFVDDRPKPSIDIEWWKNIEKQLYKIDNRFWLGKDYSVGAHNFLYKKVLGIVNPFNRIALISKKDNGGMAMWLYKEKYKDKFMEQFKDDIHKITLRNFGQ
jgi:hypothetical protein